MANADKQAAADAMKRLEGMAEMLLDDDAAQARTDLAALSRYQAELRRERSAMKDKLDLMEKSLTAATERARKLETELGQLKQELIQTRDQLAGAKGSLAAALRATGGFEPGSAQAHLENLSIDSAGSSPAEIAARQSQLLRLGRKYIGIKGPPDTGTKEPIVLMISQRGFADEYQADEYTLLGMAIRLAGEYGQDVYVIRPTAESVEESRRAWLAYRGDTPKSHAEFHRSVRAFHILPWAVFSQMLVDDDGKSPRRFPATSAKDVLAQLEQEYDEEDEEDDSDEES